MRGIANKCTAMRPAKPNITTATARRALKPRKAIYWHPVAPYIQVGYYKPTTGVAGTWHYRTYFEDDTGKRRQVAVPLGDALSLTAAGEQFAKAQALAVERAKHAAAGGSAEILTLRQACSAYVEHLRDEGQDANAKDADARFRRWVFVDAIASIELGRLRKEHLENWRKGLRKTPVTENPHARRRNASGRRKGKVEAPLEQLREHPRSEGSVNRDLVPLRAALNRAYNLGHVPNDLAWRESLKPKPKADGRRDLYLTRNERIKWVENAGPDIAVFMKALVLVPLRPGALAALTVGDFDTRDCTLLVSHDKAGADRRVMLGPAAAALFAGLTANKPKGTPLLTRADGLAWSKDSWKKPLKTAAIAAGLPSTAVAYTLRHSAITDLVTANVVDLLTIARMAGTSVVMIEKHYGHLSQHHAAAAMQTLNLWGDTPAQGGQEVAAASIS